MLKFSRGVSSCVDAAYDGDLVIIIAVAMMPVSPLTKYCTLMGGLGSGLT